MKKHILINSLAILSVLLFSCASRKDSTPGDVGTHPADASVSQVATIQKITFNSGTRGYSKSIWFTPDSVSISVRDMHGNQPDIKKTMNVKEWSLLTTALFGIRLEDIPKLEAPTTLSQTDAAMGSSITISTSDQKMYAHHFDDTNPNAKLQKLMDAILALEKAKR